MWDLVVEAILWVCGGLSEQFVKYRLAKAAIFQGPIGYRVGLFLEMAGYFPFAGFTIWRVLESDVNMTRTPFGIALGGALALVGFIINYIAVRDLKVARWNSAPLYGVEKELNSLVDTGIYRRVRHPSYLGQIIMFAGCAVLTPSRYIVTFAIVYALYAVLLHTRIEEHFLVERFGEAYIEYRRRVPAFLPLRGWRVGT